MVHPYFSNCCETETETWLIISLYDYNVIQAEANPVYAQLNISVSYLLVFYCILFSVWFYYTLILLYINFFVSLLSFMPCVSACSPCLYEVRIMILACHFSLDFCFSFVCVLWNLVFLSLGPNTCFSLVCTWPCIICFLSDVCSFYYIF